MQQRFMKSVGWLGLGFILHGVFFIHQLIPISNRCSSYRTPWHPISNSRLHVMDQSTYEADRSKNCLIESPICERFKTEPCWLGIDEAGRGPVLGPMVYGICFSPNVDKEKFIDMKFADSKTLSEEQRQSIFSNINDASDILGWMVEILTPTYISTSMLRRDKYNLNSVSHDCAIRLIQTALDRGVNVSEVYVDTVGDPVKYQAKLKGIFPSIDVTVAKKADSLYPIVSAASICAKVSRDQAVKSWAFIEGITLEEPNFGSGYPGGKMCNIY